MAASVFLPFNHRPSSNVTAISGDASTYTPGAGKYARAVITLSGSASAGAQANPQSTNSHGCTVEVWLDTGDVLLLNKSTDAATTTTASTYTATASASASVNSSVFAEISPTAYYDHGASTTIAYMIHSDVSALIEEYDIPS